MPAFVRVRHRPQAPRVRLRRLRDYRFPHLGAYFPSSLLDRVHVVELRRLPIPRLERERGSWLPRLRWGGLSAITFGRFYLVEASSSQNETTHFHELVHVLQWQEWGVVRFAATYLWDLLRVGYQGNRFEALAFSLQQEFVERRDPFDVVARVELSHARRARAVPDEPPAASTGVRDRRTAS